MVRAQYLSPDAVPLSFRGQERVADGGGHDAGAETGERRAAEVCDGGGDHFGGGDERHDTRDEGVGGDDHEGRDVGDAEGDAEGSDGSQHADGECGAGAVPRLPRQNVVEDGDRDTFQKMLQQYHGCNEDARLPGCRSLVVMKPSSSLCGPSATAVMSARSQRVW